MKTAVVLFNLGGPDKPESVKFFLFNLFKDPYIIRLPSFLRLPLAWLISRRRNKEANEIYAEIGGKSPILEITNNQAGALERQIQKSHPNSKTFVCMRYWHPMTKQVVADVKKYNPDNIFLLPLYPQYSTTTTKSSLNAWFEESKKQKLIAKTNYTCCYPVNEKFIEAHVSLIENEIKKINDKNYRILFSAHSLPVSIIKSGDPYQWQVEQTVQKILEKLNVKSDYVLCYQSKVTPVKWLEPSTPVEIEKAAKDNKSVIVVPIAFVSDHSETLVELDIQYKELAENLNIKNYLRVEALNINEIFINTLSEIVVNNVDNLNPNTTIKICPQTFKECYHNNND